MKKALISILAITLTLSFYNTSQGQIKEEEQSLKGNWRFILGDDMRFADPRYDDREWEKIRVPAFWEREGFRNYDGFAWYRKTFELDMDDKSSQLYLHLGEIDDVDEVYLNGKKIGGMGSFPPNFQTAYNMERIYAIPANLIKRNGENLVAVRVYDNEINGGITGWDIGVYNYSGYSEDSFQLMGQWKFNISDDMAWAAKSYDDSQWEEVMVPARWESQGFKYYDGYAWYRKNFVLPKGFDTSGRILIMGKIDDVDEVYVNGTMIGSTGVMGSSRLDDEYQKMRTYFIPKGVLQDGKNNVIAVRVYDDHGEGGIYEGPVVIIDGSDYKEFWRDYYRKNYDFPRWFMTYFED